ncbi:MAG: polymer-forming cytoskeletal protein [Burkholderiaceae bacterium]|jgi:cytoskeletal protein CcmA (bactofilin family)|nr:polymer-forming cytoskeletal protein [Burkholderiaceae bacterium]
MFGNKTTTTQKTIGTLIGAGTVIEGTVTYTGGLRIDGTVKGDVRCVTGDACMVVISEHGKVEGEVHAAHLVVSGAVNGPLHVSELLELQPKARITGDVYYRAVEIHHGAVVEGRLIYTPGTDARPALKLAASGTTSET